MKLTKITVIATLTAITTLGLWAFKANDTTAKKAPQYGFALIELFTSEGCSSCPPADDLVAKIVKEDKDKPVYVLGFHVDYWNRLGWKDEFSKAEYAQRQRRYAELLKTESVYTPQIVVNGKKEFVGSSEGTLRNTIAGALQKTGAEQLTISGVHFTGTMLNLQYQTTGGTANRVLLVAFVQKNAQSKVRSGENSGHTLTHVNIVRDLESVYLKQSGGGETFRLPAGFDNQTWEVITFVQNTATGEIIAAQKVEPIGA